MGRKRKRTQAQAVRHRPPSSFETLVFAARRRAPQDEGDDPGLDGRRSRQADTFVLAAAFTLGIAACTYTFGPTTMRMVPTGGVWNTAGPAPAEATPPNPCISAICKALNAASGPLENGMLFRIASKSACVSARTTTVTPANCAPEATRLGWFASRGISFGGIGAGSDDCHSAALSRLQIWRDSLYASVSSRGYMISTGAFGFSFSSFKNASLSICLGDICFLRRAVSLFNSAISRELMTANSVLSGRNLFSFIQWSTLKTTSTESDTATNAANISTQLSTVLPHASSDAIVDSKAAFVMEEDAQDDRLFYALVASTVWIGLLGLIWPAAILYERMRRK